MESKIIHYDLFAGIGGFSLALDTVFYDQKIKHIFCEWEAFPTAVLKKHWADATYYGDIADIVADTDSQRRERERREDEGRLRQSGGEVQDENEILATTTTDTNRQRNSNGLREVQEADGEISQRDNDAQLSNSDRSNELTILTGGFPCQPFSHAGRRQGTSDDRYKWPEMFAVIRNVRPDWVIAENVRGLVTWSEGMVLETVCADLESEGYEVKPLIIPAVAVGAPHRRDRVWIVANRHNTRSGAPTSGLRPEDWSESSEERQHSLDGTSRPCSTTSNTRQQLRKQGSSERMEADTTIGTTRSKTNQREHQYTWADDWREVAFATCHDGVDDGLPRWMDGVTISASRHRKERLKACGNAIVPQVAMEIFKAIRNV